MTISHDPDLPFAVVGKSKKVYARFLLEGSASDWTSTREGLEVIDTTPKPRIPEDAEFLLIRSHPNHEGDLFRRIWDATEPSGRYWYNTRECTSHGDDELEQIEDEITVLDRRNDDA